MATLNASEVADGLRRLPDWSVKDGGISRKFTFAGFADAVAFVVRLGFVAEAADHHPEILISYKRVTLTYVTHSEGGLTEKDFAGAAAAGTLAASLGAS
jgi:4a-hydroxytetrahydrobiopterin dehydratase